MFLKSKKLTLAVALALGNLPAWAEDEGSKKEAGTEVEHVVVLGEKLGRSLSETTSSIATYTAEDIAAAPAEDVYDLLRRTANVTSLYGDFAFSIRGMNSSGFAGNADAPLASLVVDGVALNRFAAALGPLTVWDIDRVEVLRGPQSTTQGRNAMAGAVVMQSREASWDWEHRLRAEAGGEDTRGWAYAGGGPLIADQLAYRLSVEHRETEGDIRNTTRDEDDWNRGERDVLRFKLLYTPLALPDLEVRLNHTRSEATTGDDLAALAEGARYSRTALANDPTFDNNEFDSTSLDLRYALSSRLRLTSITSVADTAVDNQADFDRGPTPQGVNFRVRDDEDLTEELRLNYEGEAWTSLVGLFYGDFDIAERYGLDGPFPSFLLPDGVPSFDVQASFAIPRDRRTYALFGETDWRFAERWTATAGLRWEREDGTDTNQNGVFRMTDLGPALNTSIDGLLAPWAADSRDDYDFEVLLPKAGLRYEFSDAHSLGFVTQKGYRSGGVSVAISEGVVQAYDPEYTWNYELGYKSRWYDGRLLVNANVFYTDWREQQVAVGGIYSDLIVNAGVSHLSGFELEGQGWLDEDRRWNWFAGLGHVQSRFDDFVNGDADYTGNEIPDAPQWTANAGLGYRSERGWFGQLDAAYVDEAFTSPNNDTEERAEERTLVNAKLGYAQERWQLALYLRNALDERYAYNRFVEDGVHFVRQGDARLVGLQVDVSL